MHFFTPTPTLPHHRGREIDVAMKIKFERCNLQSELTSNITHEALCREIRTYFS